MHSSGSFTRFSLTHWFDFLDKKLVNQCFGGSGKLEAGVGVVAYKDEDGEDDKQGLGLYDEDEV